MAIDFPQPSQVGEKFTDTVSGKTFVCTNVDPAVWASGADFTPGDADFVTVATNQTITGTKDFTAATTGFVNVTCSGDLTTSDLVMSNMHREGNEIDGTNGHWTFQEGKTTVYVINRLTGQRYNMNLEPVDE